MSKRNFILLIIALLLAVIAVFGFLFLRKNSTTPGNGGGGTNFLSGLNPFGKTTPTPPSTTPPVNIPANNGPTPEELQAAKLKKVSSMPIAGFAVFSKERLQNLTELTTNPVNATGTAATTAPTVSTTSKKTAVPATPPTEMATAVRYMEKAEGFIYETFADNLQEQKFSETIIPEVYDAYFGNTAQSVIMRYLKTDNQTIESFAGALPKEYLGTAVTGNNDISGSFLPENIKDVSISPDGSKMFYLFNNGNSAIGATLNLTTNQKVQVFTSPFTEWNSQWPTNNVLTLTTRPSGGVPGYMYELNPNNKNSNQITRVFGNINGLTTLTSPDGKTVLYADNNLTLGLYHISTGVSETLDVRTLPDKCVWNNGSTSIYCAVPKSISAGLYPDDWYRGEVSFSDQIWKINVGNGNPATMISDPVTVPGGEDVDGVKLALDGGENYLFFINKKDSYLWELNLK